MKGVKKNSQGAIEFIIIFIAFLFFFTIFFSAIKINNEKKELEKQKVIAQNVALDAQYEINLASESSEGYSRRFNVPENIYGKDYDLYITDNRVFVFIDDFSISYKVAGVTGSLQKGSNVISKENGEVFLN